MDYVDALPDMMCLSKALTERYQWRLPLLPTKYLMLFYEDINKALFHGHTFTANPTGCAAALASWSY
jgi:adenosylmethionine-8-amino-7-oxononanoate aminotransferase